MSNLAGRRRLVLCLSGAVVVILAGSSIFLLLRNGNTSAAADRATGRLGDESPRVPVKAATAEVGTVSQSISTSSTLEAEQAAEILAKTEGLVSSVKVREGQSVALGEILASLDDTERRLALDKARLRLAKAQAEFERARLSREQQLVSQHDFEKALFERDLAASELKTAELELQYTDVQAPFAGRITESAVVPGKTVKKGDHLFTLADFDSLVARLYLPEKDVFRLKPGLPVDLGLESQAGFRFAGRIRNISPVVDPKTGTVKVTVDVAASSPAIRPGAFVRVSIVTDVHPRALLVPKPAVVREGDQDFVFVASEGVAVRRPVRVGYSSNGVVEILEGVQAGEPVVVGGQGSLKDGSRLEILR